MNTVAALIPRCPIDGSRLVLQDDGSYKCSKCGYIKPAPANNSTQVTE